MPKLGKKEPPNPISLAAQVIANVITPLDLTPDEQAFVSDELKWLFSAVANFQQVYHIVQQRLDEEKHRLSRKYALDIISDKKVRDGMKQITPQIWREEVNRSQPIAAPIPPEAKQLSQADNNLFKNLSDFELQNLGTNLENNLKLINDYLGNLELHLEREILMGADGKGSTSLQNKIKGARLQIAKILQEMAHRLNEAYGIYVTAPNQLAEFLAEY